MSYYGQSDLFLDVAKGNIPKHSDYSFFGVNEKVDAASVPEDVWSVGGLFVPPTIARIHNIKSASANDTSAGTGMRTIQVYGVTSGGFVNETITMNGVTDVPTVNSYLDIYEIVGLTAGSGNTNAGIITATAVTDATITAQINVTGLNTTRKAIRLIPTGYTGYLYCFDAGMYQATASSSADVYLLTKKSGELWQAKHMHSLSNSGSSHEIKSFIVPLVLSAGTWIKAQVLRVSNNSTLVQSSFNLILVQN